MSDFQPLFIPSAASGEFAPLETGGSPEFEPMDFAVTRRATDEFEATTPGVESAVDPSDQEAMDDGIAQDLEEGAEGGVSDEASETSVEEDLKAAEDDSEVSEVSSEDPEDGSSGGSEDLEAKQLPDFDPAVRAIESAAQKTGYEAGLMQGRTEIAERLKEIEDILAQVEGLRAEFFARSVQDVGRTVTRVAEQVIRRELSVGGGEIEGLVRGILADVQSDDDFVIRVSEDDATTLREIHPSLLELVGRGSGLRIEVDSRLMSGGALIETSYGKIDASIEQQLEAFSAGVEAWVTTEVEANDD